MYPERSFFTVLVAMGVVQGALGAVARWRMPQGHPLARHLLVSGLLVGLTCFGLRAGEAAGQPDTLQVASAPSLDAEALRTFAEVFFATHLDSLHIPGAAFVVVQDSAVLFQEGYGLADIAAATPVDAARTLFQVASVSKLFTATAIMQLVEAGELDLHTDVNHYLTGLQIEDAFGAPVTLADLLTHIAGFDERNIGYMARDAASVQPLADYLAARMPPRTLPPGTVVSYSNHGFGLAGLVVEQRSGLPFATSIRQRIFEPLGMRHSTFQLPLPDTLAGALARGYRWDGTAFVPVPLLYRNVPPAGALSTTAADMAKFMRAHLHSGVGLLQPETHALMQAQQFTHHPRLPGMAYGFIEQYKHGHRILQHGGDNPGYCSLLFMLPEERVGFFMVANVPSNTLRQRLVAAFMDRFYPAAPLVPLSPPSEARAQGARFAGAYRLNRYARRSLEKLAAVFTNEVTVGTDTAGYLVTQDGHRWVEVEPLLFRRADSEDLLAFRENNRGTITHLFRSIDLGGVVPGAYEKLSWYQTHTFVNEFYLSWIPFLLITWIVWPVGALIGFVWRWWKKRPAPVRTPGMHAARGIAILFGIGTFWFAFGFVQPFLQAVQQGGGDWLFGIPASKTGLLALPLAQMVLFAGMLGFTVQAWRRPYWSLSGRLHYTVFTLAAAAWMVFLVQHNLIGWLV